MNETEFAKVEKIANQLKGIVSEEFVSTTLFERIVSAEDTYPYELREREIPYAVVKPGSREEISEILKYANVEKIPVFIRGSASQLAGSTRPHTHGIVLSIDRLNDITIFEDYNFFECGPGCIVAKVAEKIGKSGYFLPVHPGSRVIARMGGTICNNTSAHIVDTSIGKLGDYVLGVEVVLPNGDLLETGTKSMRRPAGTDLTKFFVGGDGLLGVITKIRMRLLPDFQYSYAVAYFDNVRSLTRGVQKMYYEKQPIPLIMEMMDEKTAKIGFEVKGMPPPPGAVMLFSSIGSTEEEAKSKREKVIQSLETENPLGVHRIEDIDEWRAIMSTREVISSFLSQSSGMQWKSAEVIPNLKYLPEAAEECEHFNEGLPICGSLQNYLYAHIGAVSLHPGILVPRDWDGEKQREAYTELFEREAELTLKYGGCGGEWGQFSKRTSFFIRRYGKVGYDFVKSIKKTIDPNNILNPGILEGYR
jgi:glycolate oxidase